MHEERLIPDDLESCQCLLQEAWALEFELADVCIKLQQSQEQLQQTNEQLESTIKQLLCQLYGRRSERFVEGERQRHLDFGGDEPAEPDPTVVSAVDADETDDETLPKNRNKSGKKNRRRHCEGLPAHYERRTERIEPKLPDGVCLEDCTLLGVDVVEHMEYQRGKGWVRRLEYPKYKLPAGALESIRQNESDSERASDAEAEPAELSADLQGVADVRDGENAVEPASHAQAGSAEEIAAAGERGQVSEQAEPPGASMPSGNPGPPPETVSFVPPVMEAHGIVQAPRRISLVEGGRFGFSVAAEVLFSKFGMHVPLYRQQDSLAQMGWSPSRSTLGLIVSNAAELFTPLASSFRDRVLATNNIGTDDTPVRLLTPREGAGSRQARFWLYRGRELAPYDVFAFTESRGRDGPAGFLEPFHGILSGDCYSGYVHIEKATGGRIRFSACLSHARRYIFNAREQQPILASQMLAQFQQLYDIEDRGKTLDHIQRRELRQRESVPIMNRLRELLDSDAAAAKCVLPKSKFGGALGYLRNNWSAFQLYLDDGRIPIDNNDVERDVRRIAVGRKNWLFIGSSEAGRRTATIYTIVASAHRHDLDVWAYLHDSLEKLAHGRAAAGGDVNAIDPALLESLLPDVWAQSHPESVRNFRIDEKQQRAEHRRVRRARRRERQGTA